MAEPIEARLAAVVPLWKAPARTAALSRGRFVNLDTCGALCAAARGSGAALCGALRELDPYVAVRAGRVVAYASTLGMWSLAHAAAHTPRDMRALIAGCAAATRAPVQMLVPIRHNRAAALVPDPSR